MSFAIVTDTSSNLPLVLLDQHSVQVIPFGYCTEDGMNTCLDIESFDGAAYYDSIRNGAVVTTSQINPHQYIDCFRPLLESGQDVLYVGMSSGISGSFASSEIAAAELRESYPERTLCVVDTYGASLGEGLLVLKAVELRKSGLGASAAAEKLRLLRQSMCQIFTVDDLMHLRRSGRISNLSALAGTVLNIKPLLKGNETGCIVSCGKVIGRRRAIKALSAKYNEFAVAPEGQLVGIAHSDCPEDAAFLAELLKKERPPKEIMTVCYEPVTGAHVGPGALALFFWADADVRAK